MRIRIVLAVVCALAACLGLAASASAAGTSTLERPRPAWLTDALQSRVLAAGANGVQVAEEWLNLECPGYQQRGVSAAGCIVAPAGCTANFIFRDASTYYIGTARHCVDGVGDRLIMQVDSTTIAEVGTVVKHTPGGGEPGEDFALVQLDPAVVSKWGVNPAIPVVGGPNGVYTGCSPEVVKHYGHGYGVAVAQGKPEGGLATNWSGTGYGWTGFGAPGDSGSPVVLDDGRAAGNFTHLIVDLGQDPGSDLAGTRITKILQFAGVRLVNADGTTTGAAGTNC